MSTIVFQDFNQPLLWDGAVLGGDLSGIDDCEFLDWLVGVTVGTATSAPQPALPTTIGNSVGFPAANPPNNLSQFEFFTPTLHTPIENDVAQSLRAVDHVSVAYLSSLPLRAWLTMPHATSEYISDSSEPIPFENATDTRDHLRTDATSPPNPRESTELSVSDCIKSPGQNAESRSDPKIHPQPTKRTFICKGECGVKNCQARYKSRGGYYRHCVSKEKRLVNCYICGKTMTRWNLARHKRKICPASPANSASVDGGSSEPN